MDVRSVALPWYPMATSTGPEPEQNKGRRETPAERFDRNYVELLPKLRVALTGVQLPFACLVTLAFTERFSRVTAFQRDVDVATLPSAGGLVLLYLAVVGSVLLILDVVLGRTPAVVLTSAVAVWFAAFWYVLPFSQRERRESPDGD